MGIGVAGEARQWLLWSTLEKVTMSIGGDTVVLRTRRTNRYGPAIAVE